MLFNSVIFVIFFLAVYALYISASRRAQNIILLIAGYIFYGWWDVRFLGLLVLTTLIDYFAGIRIDSTENPRRRRAWLLVSLFSNLGVLGFFKYFNFFAESAHKLFFLLGFQLDPLTLRIILPVGVSFYTFQSISYVIDIYRRELKASRNLLEYSTFGSFFPQLVAGPIERATRLLPQVQQPRVITYQLVRSGMWLILLGYFKKVVIADNMAPITNEVFNHPDKYQGLAVLWGIYAFALQIYGDFSGYSDTARGLANLLGCNLMLNFYMPYLAVNPKDFC